MSPSSLRLIPRVCAWDQCTDFFLSIRKLKSNDIICSVYYLCFFVKSLTAIHLVGAIKLNVVDVYPRQGGELISPPLKVTDTSVLN